MSDDRITLNENASVMLLPVKHRANVDHDRVLNVVHACKCWHRRFLVDEKAAEVECADCHEKLNPMWVLTQLSYQENRWHELHARYQDEMKRLAERQKTKCQHCGQMTRISGR